MIVCYYEGENLRIKTVILGRATTTTTATTTGEATTENPIQAPITPTTTMAEKEAT